MHKYIILSHDIKHMPPFQDTSEFSVPCYPTRKNESDEKLRARLLYQSRKRGISENCLILR